MNAVTRGVKNAFRSPLRSGAIVLMLAMSIGLVLSMLVAKSSIEAKIDDIKTNAGTNITITPAGINGFEGGGSLLTSEQVAIIKNTAHIKSTSSILQDRLDSTDTNLTSSLKLGDFGARMSPPSSTSDASATKSSTTETTQTPTASEVSRSARLTVIGTTDTSVVSTTGDSLSIASEKTFDSDSNDLTAIVGQDLADSNNLKAGSTFTMYSKTITVVGIFKTGNAFQDSEIIMPLKTVQDLTEQTDEVSSVIATVDSSGNVSGAVTALKAKLDSKADITSQIEQANNTASSLNAVSSIAVTGVIGATVAGAIIVLLSMIIIVRERRREIGVIKAIGGSDIKVILQFVAESISLTITGAVIGLAIGVFASGPLTSSLVSSSSNSSTTLPQGAPSKLSANGIGLAMQGGVRQINKSFTQITSTLTPFAFIASIAITLLIAIIGSAVPVWLISKIRPSEVLRAE